MRGNHGTAVWCGEALTGRRLVSSVAFDSVIDCRQQKSRKGLSKSNQSHTYTSPLPFCNVSTGKVLPFYLSRNPRLAFSSNSSSCNTSEQHLSALHLPLKQSLSLHTVHGIRRCSTRQRTCRTRKNLYQCTSSPGGPPAYSWPWTVMETARFFLRGDKGGVRG